MTSTLYCGVSFTAYHGNIILLGKLNLKLSWQRDFNYPWFAWDKNFRASSLSWPEALEVEENFGFYPSESLAEKQRFASKEDLYESLLRQGGFTPLAIAAYGSSLDAFTEGVVETTLEKCQLRAENNPSSIGLRSKLILAAQTLPDESFSYAID